MSRKERLTQAINYLKAQGIAQTKKEVAESLGADASNISREPTDSLIDRFLEAYKGIFNKDWLLTGEGDMLASSQMSCGDGSVQVGGNAQNVNAGQTIDKLVALLATAHKEIAKRDEQIDRLIEMIEKLTLSRV